MINGNLIKQLREEKKMTQSELGASIGAEGNLISRWERGKAKPSYPYIVKLSNIFGKTIDFFIDGNNTDNQPLSIKERSVTENKGMLIFEFEGKKLEVPATAEFSKQFWEHVDKMIELNNKEGA